MMHTVVGGLRVPSPDNKHVLGSEAHGAAGKAFTALTKKRVYVWIATRAGYNEWQMTTSRSATLLDKSYDFVAGDLGVDVQWHGPDEVSVDLYDYGDGVSIYDGREAGTPSNHVATLTFSFERQTGKWVERKQ